MMRRAAVAAVAALLAFAGPTVAAEQKGADAAPLLPGTNAKAPIDIEADALVYDDKAQTATYSGNVVVVQGDSKLTCSTLVVHFDKPQAGGDAAAKPDAAADGPPVMGSSSLKSLEAAGPVKVVSKTQVATADAASYDREAKKVSMTGHVTLSDGGNVTKGDRLTYDLATGRATVDNGASGGRVKGLFVPGSGADATPAAKPKS